MAFAEYGVVMGFKRSREATLRAALRAPLLTGVRAFLFGAFCVLAPTLIRAIIGDVVVVAVFLTFVPFVIIAAIFLRPRDAAIVALVSALAADYFFMEPYFALAVAPGDLFSMGFLLLISAMVIALMKFVRRFVADTLDPVTDEHSHRVIFSERQGEAWAHWDGKRPSVKLGPHKKVAEMMEDYVAQVELGERLTDEKAK